jgi:parvulin-like peptidyl-prolyl isomerase
MVKLSLVLLSVLLLFAGCGGEKKVTEESLAAVPQPVRDGLPEPSGGFVLSVSGETIPANEIVAPMANHFSEFAKATDLALFRSAVRPQVEKFLVEKVSESLLYREAKKTAGEQIEEALDKAADKEVRSFVVSFGGDYAKAQDALQKQGMNWDEFRKLQKKLIMSQSYMREKMPESKPVTYTDLVQYYDEIKDAQFAKEPKLQFSLIDIMPATVEVSDANANRNAAASTLANELAQRARAGEDFAELARKYSHDHRAVYGGAWKSVNPRSLAAPYDALAQAAEAMRVGEIAGPMAIGEHVFIMRLDDRQAEGYVPFEEVQNDVQAQLVLDRKRKANEEFSRHIYRQAAIGDREAFIDFCTDRIYQQGRQIEKMAG